MSTSCFLETAAEKAILMLQHALNVLCIKTDFLERARNLLTPRFLRSYATAWLSMRKCEVRQKAGKVW